VARQAIENATEDKAARKARSSEEAERQQDVRRIGRILSRSTPTPPPMSSSTLAPSTRTASSMQSWLRADPCC
jgi:hypothetical protein